MEEEGDNGVLGIVLLRENDKNGGLLVTKLFRIDCRIKAQELLHLTVQKGVESGKNGGENGGHCLGRRIQSGPSKPSGLVVFRKPLYQILKLICSIVPVTGSKEFLYQLEHADYVALIAGLVILIFIGQVFRQKEKYRC